MQELLQNQYQQSIEVRFPVALYNSYGIHLAVWLLARALDPEGSGKASFDIAFAAATINRSISTIRRLLAGAVAKGLIHRFETTQNRCTLYYASLERVAWIAGLENLGYVAEIPITDLPDLDIVATEVVAQGIQRASHYQKKEELKQQRSQIKVKQPYDLLMPPCGTVARVLGLHKDRWMLVSEHFPVYGACLESIATERGIDVRTAQRHLSNRYRLNKSPVWNRRAELAPIQKRQIAQRLPRQQANLVKMAQRSGVESDYAGRLMEIGKRTFIARTNVYYPFYNLVPCRHRRKRYQNFLSPENGEPQECRHKEILLEESYKKWLRRFKSSLVRLTQDIDK